MTTMHQTTLVLRNSLTAAALALALSAGATPAEDFNHAMLVYEVNHWSQSDAGFAALADQGHSGAARLALQMWRHGPPLYDQHFAASHDQVERWSRLCVPI